MTDWKKLEHAQGSAVDVPGLLSKLDGKVVRDRELAVQLLAERFAQPCSALPALVDALLERLSDGARKDRARLWRLVVELVAPEPQRFVFDPYVLPRRSQKALREALGALEAEQSQLAADVANPDVATSAAASYVAAFLPTPDDALIAEVTQRARRKGASAARDSAWLCTGTFRRRGLAGASSPKPGKALHDRCVGHLAEAMATAALSLEGATDLARLLSSDAADPAQAWGDGDLRSLARAALARFPDHAAAVRATLLDAVAHTTDRERMQNLAIILGLAFPRAEAITSRSLDAAQRATLEGLLAVGADFALPEHGLPNVASVRAVLAGAAGSSAASATRSGHDAAPAIERELTLSPGTRPVWQWFEARLKKEIADAELMEAVAARFSADELWDVVAPAFTAERGHALPTMAFAEFMSGKVSLDRARLDAYVAAAIDAGKGSKPPRSAFGAFALLRFGAPPEHAAALEALARSATFGNDAGVIARLRAALPPAVRDAIAVKR